MVSVIIAAFNEEERIRSTLERIVAFFMRRGVACEIIVVNDGSTDRTTEVIAGTTTPDSFTTISCGTNRGKGYALRTGVLASKGDLVLLTDADLSTPIEELDVLLPYLTDHAIAIGSRALALSQVVVRQPWWRQIMGKTFNFIIKALVMNDFSDTQCGFKLLNGDVARELFGEARIDRFAFDVEILYLAKRKGYNVAEVPITWVNSPNSRVRPVRDSLIMLRDVVRIRTLHRAVSGAKTDGRSVSYPRAVTEEL
jgi:dolichyl-phosphate beta-glucosyltransferase